MHNLVDVVMAVVLESDDVVVDYAAMVDVASAMVLVLQCGG
jgi:hypothetical protein